MKRFLFLFLIPALLLCACTPSGGTYYETDLYAMDTYMTIRVYGSDAQEQAQAAVACINTLNSTLSATDPHSALYRLNRTGTSSDATICTLLRRTLPLSERTGGTLDPTVYPLVCLWGFPGQNYRVPTASEISAALAHVGTSHILLSGSSVSLDHGTQLDFGAVGKGYAGQQCAALLSQNGVAAALLCLGGNIQTLGTKPDGSDWVVGITDPNDTTACFGTLHLSGTHAIVTSGSYQRQFTQDGKTYHHILDPATGYPADSGLVSVTIVADDGFLADGLSTALFVMGLEKATDFYRQSDDFEAIFMTTDGTVYLTAGLSDCFTGCEYEVISR